MTSRRAELTLNLSDRAKATHSIRHTIGYIVFHKQFLLPYLTKADIYTGFRRASHERMQNLKFSKQIAGSFNSFVVLVVALVVLVVGSIDAPVT